MGFKESQIEQSEPDLSFPVTRVRVDQWIANSLLQKSIRRGETLIAQRAALTFYQLKRSAIWRRLMIIAFEDIGIGSVDTLVMTANAGSDSAWRKQNGGDVRALLDVVQKLAEVPKDRSSDYLCGTKDHPGLSGVRGDLEFRSLSENLRVVANRERPLTHRALAAWYASGMGWSGEKRPGGNLPGLLGTFRELGVPSELVSATELAAARTREPITFMVPLVWLAANDGVSPTETKTNIPPTVVVDDVPLYALDKHTRTGREAIRRFVQTNDVVRACLERYAPSRVRDAAYMAAFYTDAVPIARKLAWTGSNELKVFGTQADMLRAGVTAEGIEPVLETAKANLGHLNEVRAEVFRRAREPEGQPTFWAKVGAASQ